MDLDRIEYSLRELTRDYHIPGLVAAIVQPEDTIITSRESSRSRRIASDTCFDCASLTKPIVTALSLLILEQEGLFDANLHVSHYLPEMSGIEWSKQPVINLVYHTSGLPAWYPLYAHPEWPDDFFFPYRRIQQSYKPGKQSVYSCLDYILLGKIVERLAGVNLPEWALVKIFEPLGMKMSNVGGSICENTAPTENGNSYEIEMAERMGFTIPESRHRANQIKGETHDSNAFFAGGYAGNAGLFSDIYDLVIISRSLLEGLSNTSDFIITGEQLQKYLTDGTPQHEAGRGYGWLLSRTPGCCGDILPEGSFGHTGFTGTSLWFNLRDMEAYILLTNRIYPSVTPVNMTKFRREFHRLAMESRRL